MASWFTRALDKVTPWNRGGEVQRRQEGTAKKKKKEEEERQYRQAQTVRRPQSQPNQPDFPTLDTNLPVNVFDANKNLNFGQPNNNVQVFKTPDVQPAPQPQPGEIIRPKQSIGNRFRDVFDANTEADRYRRTVSDAVKLQQNIQDRGVDPRIARETAIKVAKAQNSIPSRTGLDNFREGLGEAAQDTFHSFIGKPVKAVVTTPIEAGRELVAQATGNKEAARQANRRMTQNLFSKEILEKQDRGEKIGKLDTLMAALDVGGVLPILGGAKLVGLGAKEAVVAKSLKPFLKGATAGVDEALLGIRNLPGVRNLFKKPSVVEEVAESIPRPIPVKTGIPVDEVVGDSLDIPVQVNTPQKPTGPIIREVGGDAPNVTRVPTPAEAAEQRLATKVANEAPGRPDQNIEGVTPRASQKPFVLDEGAVAKGQDDLIDEYAGFLKQVGEGNGTQLVPDGMGGYIRTSDNVRFGDTKGKRMTKADWRDEAVRQLNEGKADPSIQKVFDEAADPEVQSLLAKGEQPDVPAGQPITVKQVNGIDVIDQTNVSQNLPETPGTVRVTTATAPSNIKSETVAAQTPAITPPAKTATGEVIEKVPTTPKQADEALDGAYERLVKSLKENQTAQKVEKKINKAEKSRRFAEKKRIYDELVASGVSRREAEARATAALKGKYTDNTVANFDVDSKQAEAFRKAIDDVSDDPFNTKRAFEHMIDPTKTDPLQPWERTRIRRFVQSTLGEDAAQALDEAILLAEQIGDRSAMGRVADFTTSAIAAGDISATGRQGLFGLINHPKMSGQAFKEAMGALVDPKKYDEFAKNLVNDPNTAFIQENMGGKYLTLSDIADEARGSDTTNRAIAWYVNPSNRHYNTYLDSLRHQQKSAVIERYGGQEGFLKAAEASGNPDKWMKAWGNVVDRMSGRGSFSKTGSPTVGDVQVLFSARNLASKFQRLTAPLQVGLLKTNPDAYLYQLREVAQPAAVLGTALTLVGASGLAEIENGKIKIGNTRIDITGGFATIINSMNNIRKAFTEESDSGFARTGWDVTKDFFQNQLSPVLGTIGQLMDIKKTSTGMEDRYGNEVDVGWLLEKAPIPAIAQTAIDSRAGGESWFQTAANVFSEGLGFGANTYQTAEDKEAARVGKDTYKNLKDTAKQLEKEGISTENDDINNYVADGEYNKAYRAREYQLAEIKAEPGASPTKIKKAENALKEVQLREQGVPLDEDEIQSTVEQGDYDSALQGLNHKLTGLEGASDAKRKPIETDIKRLEITRDGKFDPSVIKLYQNMSNTEWRKIGDPEDEDYDPDLYQLLWDYDEAMAKAGVSRSDFKPDKQKYSGKKGAGKGKGKGTRQLDTSFGRLKDASFAPQVQQYESIGSQSGGVPRIGVKRPNIVHNITSSR